MLMNRIGVFDSDIHLRITGASDGLFKTDAIVLISPSYRDTKLVMQSAKDFSQW